MPDEKYIVNCPRCGRIEGILATFCPDEDDRDAPLQPENVIEQAVVETPEGQTTRFRCPQCGRWVASDRVSPG